MGTDTESNARKISADIFKVALETMKGAPFEARIIIFVQALNSVVFLFAAVAVFFKEPLYGLIAMLAGVILSIFILRHMLRSLDRALPRVTWSREYIDNYRAAPSFEHLARDLEDFRQKAADAIRRVSGKDISKDDIRSNIFLPDCTDSQDGYLFRLYMPTPLRRNMNHPPEWDLRFRPGQGCTGTCFSEGVKRIALTRDFRIDDEFRDRINPKLKWIIALPIMRNSEYTIAVLSIDSLGAEIEKDVLEMIATELGDDLSKIEKEMNRLPFARLIAEVANA